MVVAGEWILYSNLSDGEKLYRVKSDGTNRSKIGDDRVGYLNFDQRYIYYTNTSQQNAVFRIMPDGSGRSKVVDGGKVAGPVGIVGSKLYYRGLFYDIKWLFIHFGWKSNDLAIYNRKVVLTSSKNKK